MHIHFFLFVCYNVDAMRVNKFISKIQFHVDAAQCPTNINTLVFTPYNLNAMQYLTVGNKRKSNQTG